MERHIPDPGFAGDTGGADPTVAAALTAYDAAPDDPHLHVTALRALLDSRLLVPVVAVPGSSDSDDAEVDARGLAHDRSSDMAAVLMTGADGRLALLAFTSLAALRRWDPRARPVPVPTRTAARSAVQEDAAAVVVDIAGPVRFVVEGEDLTGAAAGWDLVHVDGREAWIRPQAP